MPAPDATAALHSFVWDHLKHENPSALAPSIKEFIAQGADLNYPTLDDSGEAAYPLALACASGSFEWTKLLLELGARVNVEPRKEDVEGDSFLPATPFDPLGRIINFLEYELEDDGPQIQSEDHSQGPVGVLRLLLDAGAQPLLGDPLLGISPLTQWCQQVEERLVDIPLSRAQVETALAVTDALLSCLPPDQARALRNEVLNEDLDTDSHEVQTIRRWPEALLDAWRSQERAATYDASLPAPSMTKKPSRF